MNLSKVILTGLAAAALATMPAAAQFDLQSQRKEVQNYLKVPGHKVDHKGIIVNPTPHKMAVDSSKSVSFGNGFKVSAKQWEELSGDFTTLQLPSSKNGLKLNASYGDKVAAKAGVKNVKGAYALNIDKNGVDIKAFDRSGVFYALQTLRQPRQQPGGRSQDTALYLHQ